jgi:alpha-N-acetylglucosamine transferase
MLKSDDDKSNDARLLRKVRDEYNVNLVPITVQRRSGADSKFSQNRHVWDRLLTLPGSEGTWADSYTKLLAFNQTQYRRVLSVDSDTVILQDMDELFLLPSVPVAMPRAYWLWPDREILSAHVMVIEPSQVEFDRVMDKINSASGREYDMEIINSLYRDSALVLPHRGYAMLTGEFRSDNHTMYLGSDVEIWDPVMAYSESKLIHFSDWPLPKPWLPMSEEQHTKLEPDCTTTADGTEDCTARIIWNSLYTDFKEKRKVIAPPKCHRTSSLTCY